MDTRKKILNNFLQQLLFIYYFLDLDYGKNEIFGQFLWSPFKKQFVYINPDDKLNEYKRVI